MGEETDLKHEMYFRKSDLLQKTETKISYFPIEELLSLIHWNEF